MMRTALLAALSLSLLAGAAAADVIYLKSGGKVEGVVTDLGDRIQVRHRYGTAEIAKSEIVRIEEKASLYELYKARLEKIDPEDADARVALGKWLRENEWESQAVREFRRALAIDPDHRAAHAALGDIFYEGEWRSEAEIMEMKGYVKVGAKWIPARDAEELAALEERKQLRKEQEKEARAFQRKLRGLVRKIHYGTGKESRKAHDDLVTVAREIGDPDLEKYAGAVKAWSDRYWKVLRERQIATTEIQATMSNLKRPIPTFTTSLGALSTPVTLQLPELAIASVKTTVPIPAGR